MRRTLGPRNLHADLDQALREDLRLDLDPDLDVDKGLGLDKGLHVDLALHLDLLLEQTWLRDEPVSTRVGPQQTTVPDRLRARGERTTPAPPARRPTRRPPRSLRPTACREVRTTNASGNRPSNAHSGSSSARATSGARPPLAQVARLDPSGRSTTCLCHTRRPTTPPHPPLSGGRPAQCQSASRRDSVARNTSSVSGARAPFTNTSGSGARPFRTHRGKSALTPTSRHTHLLPLPLIRSSGAARAPLERTHSTGSA